MIIEIHLEHDHNVNIHAFNIFEPFLKVLHICLTYLYNFCLWEVFAKKAFIAVCHIVLVPLLISYGKKILSQACFSIKYNQICICLLQVGSCSKDLVTLFRTVYYTCTYVFVIPFSFKKYTTTN